MNPLIPFTQDETTREAVFDYLMTKLDEHALSLVYRGIDARGVKDARDVIVKTKQSMIHEFLPKEKPNNQRAV